MHFFDRTLYLQICIWKQTFSLGKDERYRLTFDWRFSALSQSEIRVHWWTHNSKNPTNLGRREFNSTLHQSSHGFATRVHGFATKTKALAHKIPPATQAMFWLPYCHTLWRHQYLICIIQKSWISLERDEIWQKGKHHSSSLLKAFQIRLFSIPQFFIS